MDEEVRHESDRVEKVHNVIRFDDVAMVHVDNEMNKSNGMMKRRMGMGVKNLKLKQAKLNSSSTWPADEGVLHEHDIRMRRAAEWYGDRERRIAEGESHAHDIRMRRIRQSMDEEADRRRMAEFRDLRRLLTGGVDHRVVSDSSYDDEDGDEGDGEDGDQDGDEDDDEVEWLWSTSERG